jgi:hypothetical protein
MRYAYRNIRFHVFLGGLVLSLPVTWAEFVEWGEFYTDVSGLWKGIGFITAVTVGFIYTWLETRRKDPDKRVSVMLWVLFVVAILMHDIMVLYYHGGFSVWPSGRWAGSYGIKCFETSHRTYTWGGANSQW